MEILKDDEIDTGRLFGTDEFGIRLHDKNFCFSRVCAFYHADETIDKFPTVMGLSLATTDGGQMEAYKIQMVR